MQLDNCAARAAEHCAAVLHHRTLQHGGNDGAGAGAGDGDGDDDDDDVEYEVDDDYDDGDWYGDEEYCAKVLHHRALQHKMLWCVLSHFPLSHFAQVDISPTQAPEVG